MSMKKGETYDENNIPIVEAIPMAASTAVATTSFTSTSTSSSSLPPIPSYNASLYYVDLPLDRTMEDLGIQVQGSPAQLMQSVKLEQNGGGGGGIGVLQGGHYVHGIMMESIEIVCIDDLSHLKMLINENRSTARRLIISCHNVYADPCIAVAGSHNKRSGGRNSRVIYKHTLPPQKDLGFTMQGFPPIIQTVMSHSPLQGRLHPNQTVEAVILPGADDPIVNLDSGGFTSNKVQQILVETSTMFRRQLVVRDAPSKYDGVRRTKGSSPAMDDCVIQ